MADNTVEILLRARAEFSDLTRKISGLKKDFQGLKLPKDITENVEKGFSKLEPILKNYQRQLDKGFKSKTDLKNFETTRNEVNAIFNDITSEIQKVNGQPIQLKTDLKEIEKLEKKLNNLKTDLEKKLNNISIDKGKQFTNDIDKLVAVTTKASSIKPMALSAQNLFNEQEFEAYNTQIDKIQQKILSLSNKSGAKIDLARSLGFKGETFTKEGKVIEGQVDKVNELITKFFNNLKVSDHSIGGLEKVNNDIARTGEELNQLKIDSLVRGKDALTDFGSDAGLAAKQAAELGNEIDGAASSSVRMAEELQQLKTSTQYFFSLRNMLNLFKQGVREAIDVIKELDAAMTETAVVTDFSVGDMWKKLPEYTANANALGASVKDMYEATTLYYQQGLDTNQAMGIAAETMKMARIGGLEATDATDKMTAALRGFNMELNEVSAQRVNDVYSNLAAKTASDTNELGTAMQRTASIAASAGMSFEGTAAFLAQAIETTREPAENLGTAMKTIVARFTELKKNPLEITEVDGEEVDYNKVDTALKSIGVSLKDTNGQFRDLDKVFLDISQRWNGLTQTQQRYIATIAAGSRQQSRFIAMMSNYDRTVQLMNYANDSAGASNEQFGKTMESLQAKLNKLRNAWNEFLMGIMNDSMTKFVVDAGTKALDILNKITDVLSFGGESGLLKSITSLTAAFIGLKAAGKLINWGVDKAGGLLSPSTPIFGFKGEGGKVSKTTATIVNPIVAEIRQVVAAIKNQTFKTVVNDKVGTIQQYKDAQRNLENTLGLKFEQRAFNDGKTQSIKYSDINNEFKNLSASQQRQLMGTLPGLQQAMSKGTLDLLKSSNVSKNGQKVGQQIIKDIIKGMNKGTISVEKGIDLLRHPQKWGEIFGNEFNEGYLKEINKAVVGKEHERLIEEAKSKYIKAFKEKNGQDTLPTNEDLAKRQTDFEKYAQRKITTSTPIDTIDYQQYNQIGDLVGQLGTKFTVAGQSIQQFGMFLSSVGFEKAGGLIINLGTAVMGLSGAFTLLGGAASAASARVIAAIDASIAARAAMAASGGMAWLAPGGGVLKALFGGISLFKLAATGIAIGVTAILLIKKHLEKKAQEAGQEVREQFEEGFTKATDKIDSLEGYKTRFNELAKGVDQFGHNVSLSTEEYDEYLSISKELQQISPSLIAGYNAEGQAIIKKGEAIQGVIDKLKEERQAELDLFTSNASVDKLIGEYETSDAYKQYSNKIVKGDELGSFVSQKIKIGSLTDENLIKSINQLSGWDLDSLSGLTNEQLLWLSQHYNDVINLVEEQNGKLEDEVKEGYVDAFTNAGVAIKEVMTEGQPIIDAMQMWMGSEGLDIVGLNLGEEFSNSFNQGMQGVMLTGLTEGWESEQYKTELRNYAEGWKDLAGETSEYNKIMAEADEIQQQYLDHVGEDGAIEQYTTDIEDSANALINLAEQYKNGTAAEQAFAEQCSMGANALRNYANEGMDLSEALNTASDEIASAESALDNFNKATEKDFWTAAEGMKSIYDKATETFKDSFGNEIEKHFEGSGDKTAWEAGTALFGEKGIEGLSGKQLREKFKEWEPALREGEEGWYNFWNKITGDSTLLENLKKIDGVHWDQDDFYIPDDKWAEVAETIGISEDMLTSMLNKGRQFADIDFANWKQVRHSFETSDVSIKGTSAKEGEQQTLYVKADTFKQALADAGYTPQQYAEQMEKARSEQGFEFVENADEITVSNLQKMTKDWGVETLPDLIETLNETGDYTKDEIEAYAEKLGWTDGIDFDKIYTALEDPEAAEQTNQLAHLNGTTTSILGAILGGDKTPKELLTEAETARQETFGNAGVDTQVEAFGLGKKLDENGQLQFMTKEEFAVQSHYIEGIISDYEQAAQMAQENANATTGETKKQYQAVADYYTKLAADTQEEYERGQKGFQSNLQIQAKKAEEAADREASIDKAKKKKVDAAIAKNGVKNKDKESGYTKTPGHTETESKKVEKTEKTETTTQTTIVDGETTPNFEKTKKESDELKQKDNAVIKMMATAEDKGVDNVINKLGGVNDKQVKVTTVGDTSGADQVKMAIANVTGKVVKIGTELGSTSAIKTLDDKITALARKGNNIKIGTTVAKGQNNYISYPSIPSFGSAAKGRHGTVGPKNNGGLTLTGEKGFEIAWLPSENRSMILGADGPQMLKLPSDAVVYTHEQSKDIIKRKSIPAGSHAEAQGNYDSSSSRYKKTNIATSKKTVKKKKTSKNKKNNNNNNNNNNSSSSDYIHWSIEEVVRFDIDQRLQTLATQIDKTTKELDKTLKRIGTKSSDIAKITKEQVENLKQVKSQNQALAKSYQKDLNKLVSGPYNEKVSYTAGKKSKEKSVNLSNYIYYDKTTGTYQINKKKIASAKADSKKGVNAAVNQSFQQNLFKATEGALKDLTSGLDKAKDAANKAQEELDKLGEQLSESYYQWENEITEVYNLSQKLSNASSLRERFTSQIELELAQLGAGFGKTAEAFGNIQKVLARDNQALSDQIKLQQDMIKARQTELHNALSAEDEYNELQRVSKASYNTPEEKQATIDYATDKWRAAALGRSYLQNVQRGTDGNITYSIDWEGFEQSRQKGDINKETYDAIKAYLDNLESTATEYNNAIKEQTESLSSMFNQLKEYQNYVADFEDTLMKGLEEQIQSDIDNAKNISDSITNALKDLLDEVKRKLDKRRKQEDNQKTENDISRKQQRLAMLRADTSGGHAVEIAQLENEISEAQQGYQRTLEDQMLDRLQQQADEASEQRERQIELAQAMLEVASNNNKELVDMWLRDPELYKSQIEAAWKAANGYDKRGEAGQFILDNEFAANFAELQKAVTESGFANHFKAVEDDTDSLISLVTELVKQENNAIDQVTDKNTAGGGSTVSVDRGTQEYQNSLITPSVKTTASNNSGAGLGSKLNKSAKGLLTNLPDKKLTKKNDIKNLQKGLNNLYADGILSLNKKLVVDGDYGKITTQAVKALQKLLGVKQDGIWGAQTKKAFKASKYKKYISGGLATQTGPAWLDGTPSKPELVLNAADTKNFIALKDVLARAMSSTGQINNDYGGNAMYEININVDKIEKDYDVDRVIEKVKKEITKGAGYRNVTQVRNFR